MKTADLSTVAPPKSKDYDDEGISMMLVTCLESVIPPRPPPSKPP
jgi:hypothetical protein